MKKIATTLTATLLLTGAFAIPAQATEPEPSCTVEQNRLDALSENYMTVWREAEAYKNRAAVLTVTVKNLQASVADLTTTTQEQAATLDRKQTRIEKQRATIARLRAKLSL